MKLTELLNKTTINEAKKAPTWYNIRTGIISVINDLHKVETNPKAAARLIKQFEKYQKVAQNNGG